MEVMVVMVDFMVQVVVEAVVYLMLPHYPLQVMEDLDLQVYAL
jgi:hypothetical protein